MNGIRSILPGMFTMGNLACGFGAIVVAGGSKHLIGAERAHNLSEVVWLLVLAAFLDFLDGMVARFSRSSSRLGVEMDSLADIVSFGVAPGVVIISFSLISQANWAWILAFVYIMAGSFRLARFGLSASLEEKTNFVGLPIPTAAIAIVSYVLFCNEVWGEIRFEKFFIILVIASAALMVSTIEYETMPKFDFSKPKNRIKMLFLLLVAVGLMINASLIIFPLALAYIIYGLSKMTYLIFSGSGKVNFLYPSTIFRRSGKENDDEDMK